MSERNRIQHRVPIKCDGHFPNEIAKHRIFRCRDCQTEYCVTCWARCPRCGG